MFTATKALREYRRRVEPECPKNGMKQKQQKDEKSCHRYERQKGGLFAFFGATRFARITNSPNENLLHESLEKTETFDK